MKFDITNHVISKACGAVHNWNWKNKGWPVPLVPVPQPFLHWPTASWLMFLDVHLASIYQKSSKSQINWSLDGAWLKNSIQVHISKIAHPSSWRLTYLCWKRRLYALSPPFCRHGPEMDSNIWVHWFAISMNVSVHEKPDKVSSVLFTILLI